MDKKNLNPNNPSEEGQSQLPDQGNQENSPIAANLQSSEEEAKKRLEVHTLKEDLEKLKQAGGEVDFSDSLKEPSPNVPQPPQEQEPEKETPAFNPPPFSPDSIQEIGQEEPEASGQPSGQSFPKKSSKLLIIEIVGAALAVSLLISIFAYLFYFKKSSQEQIASPTPAKSASPASSTPVASVSPTPSQITHNSFFPVVDTTQNIDISLLSPVVLNNKLKEEANKTLATGSLKEIILTKSKKPVAFADFFEAMVPEISAVANKDNLKLADIFENDFSLEIAYLDNGPQLMYVAKINSEKTDQLKTLLKDLVAVPNLAQNLAKTHFFVDPGQPVFSEFKQGQLGDVEAYYILYSNNNLAFDFGIKGDYFTVFTSKASYDNFISKLQ